MPLTTYYDISGYNQIKLCGMSIPQEAVVRTERQSKTSPDASLILDQIYLSTVRIRINVAAPRSRAIVSIEEPLTRLRLMLQSTCHCKRRHDSVTGGWRFNPRPLMQATCRCYQLRRQNTNRISMPDLYKNTCSTYFYLYIIRITRIMGTSRRRAPRRIRGRDKKWHNIPSPCPAAIKQPLRSLDRKRTVHGRLSGCRKPAFATRATRSKRPSRPRNLRSKAQSMRLKTKPTGCPASKARPNKSPGPRRSA